MQGTVRPMGCPEHLDLKENEVTAKWRWTVPMLSDLIKNRIEPVSSSSVIFVFLSSVKLKL